MRVPRLFVTSALELDRTLSLSEQTAHYVNRVLRLRVASEVVLFDGSGREFDAQIVNQSKQSVDVVLIAERKPDTESPLWTHLGLGLSKGERFEWALQKATELGVSEITPLFTARTEVRLDAKRLASKLSHWQRLVQASCEQNGRVCPPVVRAPQKLAEWFDLSQADARWVLDPLASDSLATIGLPAQPESVSLLVGPEGGLALEEIALAQSAGFTGVRLGSRILRTETAPLSALTLIQARWGDLG